MFECVKIGLKDGRTDIWTNGWLEWMDADRRMARMNGYERTDGWMDGLMNERIDGWTERRLDGLTD